MSLCLLLQQCSACLVRLICMVLEIGDRWPYNSCSVRCCFEDLFNIAHSNLVQLPSSLVNVYLVHPYNSMNTTAAWKKLRFILSVRSDIHMTNNQSIAVQTSPVTYWCHFNQRDNISTLNDGSQKLVDKFTTLGSSVSSMEKIYIFIYRKINIRLKVFSFFYDVGSWGSSWYLWHTFETTFRI